MITYNDMLGRFGNIILSIYTTFYYCHKYNIDFNKIIFDKKGFGNHHWAFNSLQLALPFFMQLPELASKFIDHEKYIDLTKNNEIVAYKDGINYNTENLTFSKFNWRFPDSSDKEDVLLFGKILYNSMVYNKIKSRVSLNLSDYVGVHIRRGDFKKFPNFIDCYQTLDKINIRLSKINSKCLIFSDEIGWCKENIKSDKVFYLPQPYSIYNEWMLLSMCGNVDISPRSTFSTTAKTMNIYINNYLK